MNNYYEAGRRDVTGQSDEGLRSFFKQTYLYMFAAILMTAITGFLVQNVFLMQVAQLLNVFGQYTVLALIGLNFLLIWMIGRNSLKNPATAFGLLMLFAVIEGLTFGIVLAIYTTASIVVAFGSASAVFAGMAAYGYFTKRSLAGLGAPLFGLVIGLVVASVLNIFMHSSAVTFFISLATVVIFALFTAYDHNNLKRVYYSVSGDAQMTTGLAIQGALSLYLDFINIFFALLRLFGSTRD